MQKRERTMNQGWILRFLEKEIKKKKKKRKERKKKLTLRDTLYRYVVDPIFLRRIVIYVDTYLRELPEIKQGRILTECRQEYRSSGI